MACCGRGNKGAPAPMGVGTGGGNLMNLVGQEGMTLISYLGNNLGTQIWHSPITNARYEFGGKKKLGFVDNRDVEWITTKFWDGDKRLFAVAQEQPKAAELEVDPNEAKVINQVVDDPPAPDVEEPVAPVVETAVGDEVPVGEDEQPGVIETATEPVTIPPSPPFDPKALSIPDRKKQLGSQPYDVVDLEALLKAETADSPRTGAVSAIQAAIAAAGG